MKELLFVFNPIAGKCKIKNYLLDIIDAFIKSGYSVNTYATQDVGDATSVIASIDRKYDLIVCAGGDGTLNEIISGLMVREDNIPLGYIPLGSMNDVAHSLKISRNVNKAVKTIMTGSPFNLDIGHLNDRYFSYVAAFGAFTDISYATSRNNKNMIGILAYFLQGIKQISDLKTKHVKVEYDDTVIEEEFLVGIVSNSLYIGGFKNVEREKIGLNDGELEVLLIKMPKNLIETQTILGALIYGNIDSDYMYYFQTSKLKMTSEAMEWTLDGEFGGVHSIVNISICDRPLQIICN